MAQMARTSDPSVFKYSSKLFLLTQHYWCQGHIKSWTKDIHLKDKMKVLPIDKRKTYWSTSGLVKFTVIEPPSKPGVYKCSWIPLPN